MGILWNIDSGVLAGVMIAVYELILLPVVDWSMHKITGLLNVRALTRHGAGKVYESPLPFSATSFVCVRKRDSWLTYLIRLLPFILVTTWEFLVSSESVTRTHTTQARVMMPGDGAFMFASSELSVRQSATLELFCNVDNEVFLRTEKGGCTTKKVFTDLGTDPTVHDISQDCSIALEEINREVGGTVGSVLGIGRCGEGEYFAYWTDEYGSSQSSGQFFRIVDNRIFMAQMQSEMYMEILDPVEEGSKSKQLNGSLSGVYGSLKGVEVNFTEWDKDKFLRAVMSNVFVNGMGPMKQVIAALLVPRDNVTVEVIGETVVMTLVSTAMIAVTIALVAVVIILCLIGFFSDFHRRRRYKLNPVSGAREIASLAVVGSNDGKLVKTRIAVKRLGTVGGEVIEQTMESATVSGRDVGKEDLKN